MKKLLFPLSIFLIFFFISCQEKDTLTAEHKASIADEVGKIYVEGISNLSKLNIEIWSEPWSKNNFLSVNSGVNYFSTYTEFKDSVEHWFSLRESQNVTIVDKKIYVLTSDQVLLTSIANWEILFKNEEDLKVKALATLLWKKEADGWKIVHLHESWQ